MTSRNKIWKSVAAGAVGGLAGAWALNQFQALLSGVSQPAPQTEQPPSQEESDDARVKTAKAISTAVFKHDLTKQEKQWAGPAVHYGFGASLGAIYGALAETVPLTKDGLGTAYGTAVWAIADELAVPAFGLSQPASQAPASAHASAWASHWVFGLTTDLVRRGLLQFTS